MSESIELINPLLGMSPYVLLEAVTDADGDFAIRIKSGGGIDAREHIIGFLLTATETITGVDIGLYLEQINITRQAAGLPLLEADAE